MLLDIIARRLQWQAALLAPIILLPVIILAAFIAYIDHSARHPLANYGYLAWAMAFVGQYRLLYRNDAACKRTES